MLEAKEQFVSKPFTIYDCKSNIRLSFFSSKE